MRRLKQPYQSTGIRYALPQMPTDRQVAIVRRHEALLLDDACTDIRAALHAEGIHIDELKAAREALQRIQR